MLKNILLAFLIFGGSVRLYPQTIDNPNYGLKSHETLNIRSLALTQNSTTLFMEIENRSLEGSFCADRNIFIILPDGKRLKIKATDGIPRCPETYVFRSFGEKLYFSLTFPPLPENTPWFDLIEDCKDACFSFNPVIIDALLNQKIDHAYAVTELGETEAACREFEALLSDFSGKNCSYEGAVYWNLVRLSKKLGDETKAGEWLGMLVNSDNPLKGKYIESLEN